MGFHVFMPKRYLFTVNARHGGKFLDIKILDGTTSTLEKKEIDANKKAKKAAWKAISKADLIR